MEKRTNRIYNVQVVQYAWMAVEADSPAEAMEIAKKYVDDHITEEDFEDSEVGVHACESYPSSIDDYEEDERIFTEEGVSQAKDYYYQVRNAQSD